MIRGGGTANCGAGRRVLGGAGIESFSRAFLRHKNEGLTQMNTPTPDQEAQAAQQVQQPIVIQAQYVKDLSFENPGAPNALAGQNQAPQIGINLDLDGKQLGERQFEILLKINAKASVKEQTVFEVELTYGGIVQIADQVPKEQITAIAMIEGGRQIFPFARAVLANATRDGGYPPLLMNPVNFIAFYQQMVARQQALQTAQNTGQNAGNGEGATSAAPATPATPDAPDDETKLN